MGLRDLGYREGQNVVIDYRWAEGEYERLSDLASELVRRRVDSTAKSLKMELQEFPVRGPNEFAAAFSSMTKSRVDALAITEEPMFRANVGVFAGLATQKRLPSAGFKKFAEAGGLLGYGADIIRLFRRAAYFVDKILKGVKPADLPVEQPTNFELVINLKTARTGGVPIAVEIAARLPVIQ